jgi:hypothetical protein
MQVMEQECGHRGSVLVYFCRLSTALRHLVMARWKAGAPISERRREAMGQAAVRGMGWGERLWWMLYRHGLGRVSDGFGRIWTAFAWGEEGLDLRRGGMSCHLTMDGDIRIGRS